MSNFTVNTGVTDTGSKTVGNNDIGTVQAGGTLSDTTDITWTGGSASPGVVINNSGTINATTRGIDTSGSFSTGSFTLNNNSGARLIASGNDAFRINTNITNGTVTVNNSGLLVSGAVDGSGHIIAHASGQALDFAAIVSPNAVINITNGAGATIGASGDDAIRPGAGHITITNDGLIDSTASANRAINLNTTNTANISSFQLNNNSDGTIQSQGDAVRISATTLSATAAGTFSIDNAGVIQSTGVGANNGQAIDFNDLVSINGHVTITNEATGVIQAADADAIRPGTNATINNYGQIVSQNGTPTSTGNDGIDFQNNTGGVVNNFAGGLIDGARHGITGNNPIALDNAGTIIGHVGSGINMDTAGNTITTVLNEHTGVITGISVDGVQSGDAADVDGQIQLDNHGLIQALGTSSGHISEGVTVGGGTINNWADGTIYSSERGITFDGGGNLDGTDNPEFVASTVYNEGLIQGDGGEAIVIVGSFDDTITNKGTIIGSIAMDGGDDTLNLYAGSSISGMSDGGAGNDTVNLLGTGGGTVSGVVNFENLAVQSGNWSIVNDDAFSGGTTISAGAALSIGNGGSAGTLASDVVDNGTLAFDHSDTVTFASAISGSGAVQQVGTGTTVLSGHSSYTGGTEIVSGTLDVVATDSAGTGAITLDADAQTLRIEQTALSGGHFANTIAGFASDDTIDLAGDGLAMSAVLGPNNVLTISGGSGGAVTLQLDPNQSFAGDVFKVSSDGSGGTKVMVAADQAPVAQDGSASGDEDHAITGQVVANDPDGLPSPLSYRLVNGPQHGQLMFNADGTFTYTPDLNYNGADTFTFKSNDGILDSNTATFNLGINPVNDPPAITSLANFAVAENHMAVGTVTAVDPENDAFLFSLSGGDDQALFTIDAHTGALSFINSPDFETAADANHDNVYDLTVSVTDAFGASSMQAIHIGVTDLVEAGQTIHGGNGNDNLTGTTGNDTIDGGNGNDTINGGDGNDSISGGNGDDVLTGGRGDDTLDGGNGNDTLDGGIGNNHLTGGNGNDVLRAGDGNNVLDGGNGDDTITAGNGNNTVSGGNGNDTITLGNGNNTVTGGDGSEVVMAGNGNNSITGGNGNDVITVGNGNNILTGGNGNNSFHVGSGNNTLTGDNGNDTFAFGPGFGQNVITDFGHGDHVEFDGGVFANFAAVQGTMHQVGADTVISLDASHFVMLEHVTAANLHASDFFFS